MICTCPDAFPVPKFRVSLLDLMASGQSNEPRATDALLFALARLLGVFRSINEGKLVRYFEFPPRFLLTPSSVKLLRKDEAGGRKRVLVVSRLADR